MNINLIDQPNVPPSGRNTGTFTFVKKEEDKDVDGNHFKNLVIGTELEAIDPTTSKPFILQKTYNLLGRGLSAFKNDYRSWSGKKLTDKELAPFNGSLIEKQPVTVMIKHKKDGKDTIAVIDAFLPASALETATK